MFSVPVSVINTHSGVAASFSSNISTCTFTCLNMIQIDLYYIKSVLSSFTHSKILNLDYGLTEAELAELRILIHCIINGSQILMTGFMQNLFFNVYRAGKEWLSPSRTSWGTIGPVCAEIFPIGQRACGDTPTFYWDSAWNWTGRYTIIVGPLPWLSSGDGLCQVNDSVSKKPPWSIQLKYLL